MITSEIVARKRPGRRVVGWKVESDSRARWLEAVPPRYGNVVADHVTLAANVASNTPVPDNVAAQAIGHVDDGRGVEALVVAINGETDRPGGGTYHITWSLGPGRKAVESNDAIAEHGWLAFDEPLPVALVPARFP